MAVYKEVWFWLIIVGIVIVITGIILLVFTSGNKTLGIIVLVGGILLIIAGVIFAIYKANTKPLDVGEAGRDIVAPTLRKRVLEQAEQFNQRYDAATNKFITTEYAPLVRDFANSAGQLALTLAPK